MPLTGANLFYVGKSRAICTYRDRTLEAENHTCRHRRLRKSGSMLRPLLLVCSVMVGAVLPLAAAPASSVTQILTPEEFAAAGLAKLSPEELAALSSAVSRHAAEFSAALAPEASPRVAPAPGSSPAPAVNAAKFGAEQIAPHNTSDTPSELRTRIEGTVQDITGRAVFALENGQVWQLRNTDNVHFPRKLVNPEVVISRGIAGYKMLIVPENYVLFVKRIQ